MNRFARELEELLAPPKKLTKAQKEFLHEIELQEFEKELEKILEPKLPTKTLPAGKIVWHSRKAEYPIENSPDYLYTSLQAQQSVLHGISERFKPMVLYKLKTLRPLKLIEFKTPKDQKDFARRYKLTFVRKKTKSTFRPIIPYSWDDVKIIKYICKNLDFDGYIARFDQDQVTLCMSRVKFGRDIKVLKIYNNLNITGIQESNVSFKKGFYRSKKKFIIKKRLV